MYDGRSSLKSLACIQNYLIESITSVYRDGMHEAAGKYYRCIFEIPLGREGSVLLNLDP